MNLNDLASFIRVVELGTISAAAAAEGVPKSTISRRIARLEDELGVELLRRSARSFALTEDGRLLHARSASALQELADVELMLTQTETAPRGRLVLTAPRDIAGSEAFAKLLAEYREMHPEVRVEVRLEMRYVDLVGEGVDVALRAHEGEIPGDAGLMTRSLGAPRAGFFASREYVERRGLPGSPAQLRDHELVLHKLVVGRRLVLRSAAGGQTLELPPPTFVLDDFGLAQRIVEAGGGIGLLVELSVHPRVADGQVVRALPDWSLQLGRISLVWPASRHLAPRVRCFVALASERLTGLAWVGPDGPIWA